MRYSTVIVATLALSLVGCGAGVEEPVADSVLPSTADESPAASEASTEEPAPTPEPEAEYRPPFPKRQNLFAPLQKKRVVRREDDESGESVVLKGFGNVDGPMVVLSIDGQMTPLAEGAERFGVHVISIQPPEVVLQRGRSRWTASLE